MTSKLEMLLAAITDEKMPMGGLVSEGPTHTVACKVRDDIRKPIVDYVAEHGIVALQFVAPVLSQLCGEMFAIAEQSGALSKESTLERARKANAGNFDLGYEFASKPDYCFKHGKVHDHGGAPTGVDPLAHINGPFGDAWQHDIARWKRVNKDHPVAPRYPDGGASWVLTRDGHKYAVITMSCEGLAKAMGTPAEEHTEAGATHTFILNRMPDDTDMAEAIRLPAFGDMEKYDASYMFQFKGDDLEASKVAENAARDIVTGKISPDLSNKAAWRARFDSIRIGQDA